MPRHVTVATEDEVSEAVALRLLGEHPSTLVLIDPPLRRGGFGYLKANLDKFSAIARRQPVLLLTDLDRKACAPAFIADWMGAKPLPPHLLFRVAVREVEAWLLADTEGLRAFLSLASARFPSRPEERLDPKADLVQICQKVKPKSLREELVPEKGSTAKVGVGYNLHMTRFVRDHWSPARAAENAPSLARARRRLAELAATAP